MRIAKILLILFISGHVYAAENSPPIYTEEKPVVLVTTQQTQFVIKLKSNPTTGYSWFLRDHDADLIEPVAHRFLAPTDKKLMGAPGFEYWTFKVKPEAFKVPYVTNIRMVYSRPWEDSNHATQVVFKVSTKSME